MYVIGDVHGHFDDYIAITQCTNYSVQVGDMGFNYKKLKEKVDPKKHKFIGGNHDNYATCPDSEGNIEFWKMPRHYLGNFGNVTLDNTSFFFVRGAYSIDKELRTIGVDWWPNEEIGYKDFVNAATKFRKTQPKIVITHDCPLTVYRKVFNKAEFNYKEGLSLTAQGLDLMFGFHRPDLWIFGHHHVSIDETIDGTRFVCLDELETLEI